jgi:hypothetical protein
LRARPFVIATIDPALRSCEVSGVNRQLGPSVASVVLAAAVVAASGCGQYEAAPTDLTAMPRRPEAAAAPAENGLGIIMGEVRVETLAASQPVAFQTVVLSQSGKVVGTSSTDGHGRFRFEKSGEGLFDDGDYDLTLVSDRYRATSHIQYTRFARRSYTLSATPREGP